MHNQIIFCNIKFLNKFKNKRAITMRLCNNSENMSPQISISVLFLHNIWSYEDNIVARNGTTGRRKNGCMLGYITNDLLTNIGRLSYPISWLRTKPKVDPILIQNFSRIYIYIQRHLSKFEHFTKYSYK